ncbi:OmpH family outer membrane protein [Curvivirga aplysinae]|uniref:OmpH family outer membrane protein n=1 Tax=Curvivirga aplysinae TaxID=2529852 RepID=UPI0012BCAB5C|nr:OmpH family outer membrane protein [Curvivirga aplysinae]MTI09113.1 OmpH family outer membrane protein [Curvivirga aplysinae]
MIKILKSIFIGLSFFVLFVSSGYAQGMNNPKTAVINIERVERSSNAWKSLSEQVEAQRIAFQQEVSSSQAELQNKARELEGQRSILSPDVFAQKEQEFLQERVNLERQINERKKILDQSFAKGRQQIRTSLNKVLVKYSNDNQLDLVLSRGRTQGVVYFANLEKLDISEAILNLLNTEISSVDLTAGQQ